MAVIQEVRRQAQALAFRDAFDWLVGVVPLTAGYLIGRVVRVARIIAGSFVVGYQRGSRIE